MKPEPEVRTHRDGAELLFDGKTVEVYPTLWGAERGWKAARWANAELDRVLGIDLAPSAEETAEALRKQFGSLPELPCGDAQERCHQSSETSGKQD